MKERTFRVPTTTDILKFNGYNEKAQMDERTILHMLNQGVLVWAGETYRQAVQTVESIRGKTNQIILFPEKFAVPVETAREGIKSLRWMTKLDSRRVLEEIAGKSAPARLTKEFLQEYQITPEYLARLAFSTKFQDIENPSIGAYWTGSDGHQHAWTFIRCATAAEMMVMAQKGEFPKAELGVKTTYGNNLAKVKVHSRTEEGRTHEVSFSRLPLVRSGSKERFDNWLNMGFVSTDPDYQFVADQHNKTALPIYFASAPVVFAFYGGIRQIRELGQGRLTTNPFPIPANVETVDYLDNLRLSSLVMQTEGERTRVRPLGKTEMDLMLGARTSLKEYQNNWFNNGKRDLSYLFQPRDKE